MQVTFSAGSVTLQREEGDPKFHGNAYAKGEHALLHYLKKFLNARGFSLIKKRIWKDGHLMGDEYQPYLKTPHRGANGAPNICIYSGFYAIQGANERLNETGKVTLLMELDIYTKPQPDCLERVKALCEKHPDLHFNVPANHRLSG